MKIYTKTGDDGTTALYGGDRVWKTNLRVETYGNLDELNSFLGLFIESVEYSHIRDYLKNIQHILFNIGSVVATIDKKFIAKIPTLKLVDTQSLERQIDAMEYELPSMTAFILPGGSESVARAHVCRTVCRRTERSLVAVMMSEDNPPELDLALHFLNRLSDYFFVLARYLAFLNHQPDVCWKKDISL